MIKALLAATVVAGLTVVCGGCEQSASTAPASVNTARAGTAARLPGLSQGCLTMPHPCYTLAERGWLAEEAGPGLFGLPARSSTGQAGKPG